MSSTTPESPENKPARWSSEDRASDPATFAPREPGSEEGSAPATENRSAPEPAEGPAASEQIKEADASTGSEAGAGDTFTGEIDVPAEPRPASNHVSAPVTGGEVDAATGAAETHATAPATIGAAESYSQPPVQPASTIYVSTPTPPKNKGNRGAGILIAVLATVTYAVVHALVVLGIFALNRQGNVIDDLGRYVVTPAYWATAIVFFLALVLLVAIANRGGWWWYAIGGFLVAVVVYFGYIGATLLTNAWVLTPAEVGRFVGQLWSHPLTIAAAVVAREVTVWFGAWISARGRRVRARNAEARQAYDREVAEGPQLRQPVAGQA